MDLEHLALIEQVVAEFESEWDPTLFEQIDEWLRGRTELQGAGRTTLLEELIKVDLELSWRKSNSPSKLERYQQYVPQFNLELLAEEYHVRHRWGDTPSLDDYITRFGDLGRQLAIRVERLDHAQPTLDVANTRRTAVHRAPKAVGRFKILRPIGEGGCARVYQAQDPVLQRYVAVKIPNSSTATEFDEAMVSASLVHPAFVRVYDVIQHEGLDCIVMEFVNGCSLGDWLDSPEYSLSTAIGLVADIAEALSNAHRDGLIHCDVKPTNILVEDSGRVRITDFGLSVKREWQRSLSSGHPCGTPAFMSPEQVRGELQWLDGRTDTWALGVLLYRILCGELPFFADTPTLVFDQILYHEPAFPTVQSRLHEICAKCLKKRMSERWSGCADLATQLREAVRSLSDGGDRYQDRTPSQIPAIARDRDLPADRELIGRDSDLAGCQNRFAPNSIVTLHGTAGVGKTAIATAIGHRGSEFSNVIFMDVSPCRGSEDLLHAIVAKLQLDGTGDLLSAVVTSLRSKNKVLLILDSFDRLVGKASDVLQALAAQLPNCQVLITSSVRLSVPQESVQPVKPLPITVPSQSQFSAAAELFNVTALRSSPDYEPLQHRKYINEICTQLDGIPLAIELAAARTSLLTPKQILDRLIDHSAKSAVLSSAQGRRSLQQTVRWSIDLLAPVDRQALALLALLPAGCMTEHIEAILGDAIESPLNRVQQLQDHALIRIGTTEQGRRLWLYSSVKDVVAATPAPALPCLELFSSLLVLCEEHKQTLVFEHDSCAALDCEVDNLIAALDYANQTANPTLAFQAVECLQRPLRVAGRHTIHLRCIDTAIELAEAADSDQHMHARLLVSRAEVLLRLGRADAATLDLECVCEQEVAPAIRHRCAVLRADLLRSKGVLAQAGTILEELQADRTISESCRFDVLLSLAHIRRQAGKFDSAESILAEARRIADRWDNDLAKTHVLRRIGNLASSRGKLECAITTLDEAYEFAVLAQSPRAQHLALTSKGVALCELAQYPAAIECFDRAQTIATELGELQAIATNEGNRGIALNGLGDYVAAVQCFNHAEDTNKQLNRAAGQALNAGNRAVAIAALGDLQSAEQMLRSAVATLEDHGDCLGAAAVRLDLAIVQFVQRLPTAAEAIDRAIAIAQSYGLDNQLRPAKVAAALAAGRTGDTARANRLFVQLRDSDAEQRVSHPLLGSINDCIENWFQRE